MILFLKIISFPIRFALFLIFGFIAFIFSGLNHTFGLFLIFAASFIAGLGSLLMGITVIGGIVYLGGFIFYPDSFSSLKDSIPFLIISGVGLTIFTTFLMLVPVIAEKLYEVIEFIADWLWALAKAIIFCNISELSCI